jgi:gliding motility-associated-like protein
LYTVRLTDNNTGCVTLDTVSVKDKRHIPVLTLQELQPVTNCDPGRPNGVAIARADGDIVNHQFYWYESATATGVPVYDAPQYGDLKATPVVYTVTATHLMTGCADTAQIQIRAATLPIPAPAIEILSHVTSCLTGNGALTASVGGNTSDYVFDWYDGSVETPPADFVGETYRDLIAGIYSVTATDRITGCKSPLVSETVLDRQVYPEFDFIIRPATCGLTNGYASLVIQNEVSVADVEWRDAGGGVLVLGPNLIDVLPGTYTVIVTTELGCVTSEDISIGTEIRPYNGVSRNGDGRNDIFQIDCIENFPDNIVKIFNRAGTLVYEEHGYDNITLYFDGRSNKGFSPMGTNLPDGTYFFVINKMDGSEPISGYLEIVN